jgi:hypothetical protein
MNAEDEKITRSNGHIPVRAKRTLCICGYNRTPYINMGCKYWFNPINLMVFNYDSGVLIGYLDRDEDNEDYYFDFYEGKNLKVSDEDIILTLI